MNDRDRTMAQEFFEMGRQSVEARVALLEARERAVTEAEARLRAQAIVLGVAAWKLEYDPCDGATICTFRIDPIDQREARHDADIIEAGRRTAKWEASHGS